MIPRLSDFFNYLFFRDGPTFFSPPVQAPPAPHSSPSTILPETHSSIGSLCYLFLNQPIRDFFDRPPPILRRFFRASPRLPFR